MTFFAVSSWPLWVVSAVLIVAALVNYRTLALRNNLTMPFILTGWLLGILHGMNIRPDAGHGDFFASLQVTGLVLVLLIPVWVAGWLGAGAVKLQMGFGAWAGAFFGTEKGMMAVAGATLAAMLLCAIMAMFWVRRSDGERRLALMPTGFPQAIAGIGALIVMLHIE
jgi:prepilin peptidase CpaA